MKFKKLLGLFLTATCAALVLLHANVSVVLCDPGQQTWRLLGEDHEYSGTSAADSTIHLIDCLMSKTLTTDKECKRLSYDKVMWWYADNPAQIDLTFPASGNWSVRIDHEKRDGWTWMADICKVSAGGNVTVFATGTSPASNLSSGSAVISCYQGTSQTFTVSNGDRLALRIRHDDTTQSVDTYFYDYNDGYLSSLTSPATDPAYPVPESETIMLVGIGILILAGYTIFARKRKYVPFPHLSPLFRPNVWASNKRLLHL